MKLSDKITNLRKENNMTQEELANKIGVSRQSVSKWEAGGAQPDLDKLLKISKIFEVSTDFLIDDEIEPEDENKSENINKENATYHTGFADDFIYQYIKRSEDMSIYFSLGLFLLILSVIGSISGHRFGFLMAAIFMVSGLGLFVYAFLNRNRVYNLDDSSYFNFANNISTFKPKFKRNAIIAICVFIGAWFIFNDRENLGFDWVTASSISLGLVAIGASLMVFLVIRRNAYYSILKYMDDDAGIERGWTGSASSNYWKAITVIYLLYSFYSGNWYISWIIWVIAPIGENILNRLFF